MAVQQNAITPYPEPPSFYKLYKDGVTAGPPPPPCVEEDLVVFGQQFSLNEPFTPPLQVSKLYKVKQDGSIDFKTELLKLNSALLFLFIELLAVLVQQPSQSPQLLTNVIGTLQNMNHLINLLRPIQARHTLEYMLQMQIKQKKDALQQLRQKTADIRRALMSAANDIVAAGGDSAESVPQPAAAMDIS
eukprot:jgi/Chrzof1/4847/Cz15g01130.t1